jgi:hypothetical protein
MHSDWFNGIDILQGRWQHGEKVGYCYPSGLEKALCKWEIYVPLVTKALSQEVSMRAVCVEFDLHIHNTHLSLQPQVLLTEVMRI